MITPLRCGVDTLEATFSGQLDDEFVADLERRKKLAQDKDEAVPLMLGEDRDARFHLLPKGAGLWPYVLRNDSLLIRLGTAKNVPAMSVRLLAEGLAGLGVAGLWGKVVEIASLLGLTYQNCSRLDIALDYQGHWFSFDEMLNVVCPSGFRPVYPNTTSPQTFQFGKGDTVVRVYDKSAEIAANKHQWWVFVWRLCDGYAQGEPVYRVEVQLRGRTLKELGMRNVEQMIDSLPDLFSYGLTWCSLRIPSADSNKSRWPEHPDWTVLRTAFFPSKVLGRVRPVHTIISYDAAVKRVVGLLSSVGAAVGSADYWSLARALTTDAERYIECEMGTTFAELVESKQRRKYL